MKMFTHVSVSPPAVGSGPGDQLDIIRELDLANATYGITQVSGLHNASKAFLFRGKPSRASTSRILACVRAERTCARPLFR